MFDSRAILQLFTNVMYEDVTNHSITDLDIAAKLDNMTGVYSQEFGSMKVVDYNGVANRCAYLHKYAPLYTAVVSDTMRQILRDPTTLKRRLQSRALRICSLGGGPGTDVVGVLAALDATFMSSRQWRTFVSVVDYMAGWKSTFTSVVNELGKSGFSRFSFRFAEESFSWKYVQDDLLNVRKHKVWDAVSCSVLVTMVKCLSTFRSRDLQNVIKRIFRTISFGSFILIIEDPVEELTEIILSIAREHQMIPIFGPLRNTNYSIDELKVTRFGHTSCHQATVTSLLLVKPLISPRSFSAPQSQAPRYCVECGETIHMCSQCNRPRNVRNAVCAVTSVDPRITTLYESLPPLNNLADIARPRRRRLLVSATLPSAAALLRNSSIVELPE